MNLQELKEKKGKPTKLKMILSQRNIKQKELAQGAEVEDYQISQICSGKKTNIMLSTAKRIVRFIGCTLDDAFGDEDEDMNINTSPNQTQTQPHNNNGTLNGNSNHNHNGNGVNSSNVSNNNVAQNGNGVHQKQNGVPQQ